MGYLRAVPEQIVTRTARQTRDVAALQALLIITALLLAAAPAIALEEGQKFQDWTVGCEKLPNSEQERCFIYQTLVGENEKPMLQMAVGYLPENKEPAAILTVPLGLALPPGMGIKIDDNETIRFPYERCVPEGCIAGVPLKQELLTQMKRGAKLEVIVHDGRRPFPFPKSVSLRGFTKGFNSLQP